MPSAPTLLQNVIARGLVADRPAAALAGRLWYATDESTFYRDNGTTWDELPTGAVDSVDGMTGVVDLTETYEPIGAADAAVTAHDIDPAAHTDLFAAKADATQPVSPTVYPFYTGGTPISYSNTAPDDTYHTIGSGDMGDSGITGPVVAGEFRIFVSAAAAGTEIAIRITVNPDAGGGPLTSTKTATTSTGSVGGGTNEIVFDMAADLGYGGPVYPADAVLIEWANLSATTTVLYSASFWAEIPNEPSAVAYFVDVDAAIAAHVAELDPHPQYLTETEADAIYIQQIEKGSALGVATLDAAGFIPTDQLPGLALTTTFVVGSQALMLGLAADTGDICVRTDISETYVLDGTGDPTILANWIHLLSPTDAVASVDGRAGVVTLSDLYDASGAAASAVSTHASVSTSVHGITNTANLVYTGDSRLTDARTPTAHASSHNAGGSDALAIDAAAGTGSLRTLGTSSTSAAAGNDARLSDARTPTAHASSHNSGGSDALAIDAAAGTGSLRTLGTTATSATAGNDSRLSDTRTPSDAAYRGIEGALYGRPGVVATYPWPSPSTTTLSVTSGAPRNVMIRPVRALTVSKLACAVSTAPTTTTLFRLGIYTVTRGSGTTLTLNLVARTAASATNPVAGYNSYALDTTGGYPATYTFDPTLAYAFAVCWVGTGALSMQAIPTSGVGNWATTAIATDYDVYGYNERTNAMGTGKTDFDTSYANASGSSTARLFIRAEE
ncbi:hypothetical protein UFOVP464_20 [uncultured Caudovirales phage]|uniref:Uncharacterized protein n=1 Tax=uncultured Caudovirales phage TaxID=2100421 RepID=A0A6J5QXF1_9CAUD|nr:hypothetical protein UFOVP464_20 [uncultured Caudovirales phage]CAB4189280.1 hypothetical protein UFOVP1189_35 [uncultured Caudovirales phage]